MFFIKPNTYFKEGYHIRLHTVSSNLYDISFIFIGKVKLKKRIIVGPIRIFSQSLVSLSPQPTFYENESPIILCSFRNGRRFKHFTKRQFL